MSVHPTAIVDEDAQLGANIEVGPYAIIEAGVRLGDGVRIGPHAVIHGGTTIGARCHVHAHAVIGGAPQDKKHDGSATYLEIGPDNVFREFVTVNRGSSGGGGITRIGARNLFMATCHVAHDCIVGSDVVMANGAALGGHVEIGDRAVLGGLSAVHQRCRVGREAMVGGGAMAALDVPPFTIAQGDRARLFGLNIVGLRRASHDPSVASALKGAYRELFHDAQPLRIAVENVRRR
ncbi:MAG TPA: acyl-[acyl-carrier-protein]--UDP-N-acetylglucosamine O-acyltransferase, partial [Deltaproteobacteria bacterium]|nr:acyl-[acyl-carrier-protein]--UDP-N-acetylglucosamine O-acyltransferase [Deltaproteobacteria bacterium]